MIEVSERQAHLIEHEPTPSEARVIAYITSSTHRGLLRPPMDYDRDLYKLLKRADIDHLERLASGYPGLVSAFLINRTQGYAALSDIALADMQKPTWTNDDGTEVAV